MARAVMQMQVVIVNPNGVKALAEAKMLAEDICEDQPWNEDAKEIASLLAVAVATLTVEGRNGTGSAP